MKKFKSVSHAKHHVRAALDGDVSKIWSSFLWCATPQGVQHWNDIAEGRKKLSKRSRRYLNKLLSQ